MGKVIIGYFGGGDGVDDCSALLTSLYYLITSNSCRTFGNEDADSVSVALIRCNCFRL